MKLFVVLACTAGLAGDMLACSPGATQQIGRVPPPKLTPWAILTNRDIGASGHQGDSRIVFSRALREASDASSGGWGLDQTFTVNGVVETHSRTDSRACPSLDATMAALPTVGLLGPYRASAPPVPEEPLKTLHSVDEDPSAASDRFKVSFYNEGAMGGWVQRLYKLSPSCWRETK